MLEHDYGHSLSPFLSLGVNTISTYDSVNVSGVYFVFGVVGKPSKTGTFS